MMFALLLRAEWYKFLHSPGCRSTWNWRMFIFDNYNGVQFIPNICFLSQSSKCQSMVIKSLNVWSNLKNNLFSNKSLRNLLRKYISHNDVCKVSFLRNFFFRHMGLYMLIKYNQILKVFIINIGHYFMRVHLHDAFFDHVLEIFWSEKCAVLLNWLVKFL